MSNQEEPVNLTIDRYAVNDALSALAAQNNVTLSDDVLNELTHHVADVLEQPFHAVEAGSDHIKVSIGWSETVQYTSSILLPISEIREWMRENDNGGDDDPITNEIINDYLSESEESDWFEQCDTSKDFVSVSGRDLDHGGAEITTEDA